VQYVLRGNLPFPTPPAQRHAPAARRSGTTLLSTFPPLPCRQIWHPIARPLTACPGTHSQFCTSSVGVDDITKRPHEPPHPNPNPANPLFPQSPFHRPIHRIASRRASHRGASRRINALVSIHSLLALNHHQSACRSPKIEIVGHVFHSLHNRHATCSLPMCLNCISSTTFPDCCHVFRGDVHS
jgi:hypothetical protein